MLSEGLPRALPRLMFKEAPALVVVGAVTAASKWFIDLVRSGSPDRQLLQLLKSLSQSCTRPGSLGSRIVLVDGHTSLLNFSKFNHVAAELRQAGDLVRSDSQEKGFRSCSNNRFRIQPTWL